MDITFENNLGSVVFDRCLIGMADQWQWDGQVVKRTRTLEIDGYMARGEGFEDVLTGSEQSGTPGRLSLPWTQLEAIRLTALSMPAGDWIDLQPVQARFADEHPDRNVYTLSFFGLTLHGPKLTLPVPWRRSADHHVPMPVATPGMPMNDEVLAYQALRTREPHDLMEVEVEGTLFLGELDDAMSTVQKVHHVAEVIQQRVGTSQQTQSSSVPPGYPRPFHLVEACPELDGQMNVAHLFVERARALWNVEEQTVAVSVQMLAPPQRIY